MISRIGCLGLWLLAGCHRGEPDTATPPAERSGCDPTDPSRCALPFPSSAFQVPDPTTPTGVRNAFGVGVLPTNRDGVLLDSALINERDGFSIGTPMFAYFEDLSVTGMIPHTDFDAYLDPDATTVIVDAATGERVPHFAELEMHAPPEERALILHAAGPLAHATRYVVGIRGLVRSDGSPVAPSAAFAGLRDGDLDADPELPLLADHYEADVFPVLEQAGVPRDQLQLAWDFTTASAENVRADILAARDDAFARIPAGGPDYVIDTVTLGDCAAGAAIAKTIEGRVTVARYTDMDAPLAVFVRGADGLPAYQGDIEAPFNIQVPCSLELDPRPTPLILQYGHGVFGSRDDAKAGWLVDLANQNGWVVFAMDWPGWTQRDAAPITLMVATDLSGFRTVPERAEQGFVQAATGLRMMTTSIVSDPELTVGGVAVLDGAPVGFYGHSIGAILGTAYLGMSPDLERGVLSAATAPLSLNLTRSAAFEPFLVLLGEKYPDWRDIDLLLGVMQSCWDGGAPSGYFDALTADPLPGTHEKQVLVQVARGDAQTTTLGAKVLARALGASTVAPAIRPIWGVPEAPGGFTGSAIVEWDYTDVPPEPLEDLPPDYDFTTHDCVRLEPAGQAQVKTFLETGVIAQYCDGPCTGVRAGFCD